jgi:hypothetical protein
MIRQHVHLSRFRDGELRVRPGAAARSRQIHAIAARDGRHGGADGLDDTRAVGSRRVGKLRLPRVGAGSNVGVDRVDAGRVDSYQNVLRTRLRIGNLLEAQRARIPELTDADRLHSNEALRQTVE